MTATRIRPFARLGAAFALSAVVTGCGSAAPVRPAALDPSNPDAQESPRMMTRPDGAAPPATADSDVHTGMSPDAGAAPNAPEPHHHGSGTPPEKGSQ